jgi:hypothetical protein
MDLTRCHLRIQIVLELELRLDDPSQGVGRSTEQILLPC